MLKMFRFKYRYCKARMAAYINGELPLASRRRIRRFIDECPDCYAEYVRYRAIQGELENDLPRFGRSEESQLDHIWAAVQAEVFAPTPPKRYASPILYKARYGFATCAIVLVFWLPFTLTTSNAAPMSVTPPTPSEAVAMATDTPGSTTLAFRPEETQSVDITDDVQGKIQPVAVPQVTATPDDPTQPGQ